jgi:hypothetical protein
MPLHHYPLHRSPVPSGGGVQSSSPGNGYEEQYFQSMKQQHRPRYDGLEGEALSRAVHRDFYRPDAVGFEDRNGVWQGGIPEGKPGWTYDDYMKEIANLNPEDPASRSRMSDYVISALLGGGLGFVFGGGPVGAVVGAASGIAGTGVDQGLEALGAPGYVRFPASMVAGGGASKIGGRLVNRALGRLQPGAQQYLDDAARLGVTPRVGDFDEGARATEDFLTASRSGPAVRQASQQADEMRGAVQRFADDLAPTPAGAVSQSPDRAVADMLRSGYEQAKNAATTLFDDATRAAEGATVPLNTTGGRVSQIIEELKDVPGGSVDRLAKAIQGALDEGTPITYSRLRNWQRALNELIDNPAAAQGIGDGRAKYLLGGIMDDMDAWATANPTAGGQAHVKAMEFFKNNVTPYRVDRAIFRAATGAEDGADQLIRRTVGYGGPGNPDRVQRLMNLLPQSGRDAIARDVAENAAWAGSGQFATTSFSPSAVFRGLNVGTAARPRAGTFAFQNTPGALNDANRLSRMLRATRVTGAQSQPATGIRTLPSMLGGGSMAAGGGIGFAAGGGSPFATAAGMAAGPMINRGLLNVAGRVATSQPFVQYMTGQAGSAIPGAVGTAVPSLLEGWQIRNRNRGRR